MSDTITVTITGRSRSGKTTIAEAVYRALRAQGLSVGLTTDTKMEYLFRHGENKLDALKSRETLVRIVDGEDSPFLQSHILNDRMFYGDPPTKENA